MEKRNQTLRKSLKVIPWPGIDNAFLVVSMKARENTATGERLSEPFTSFMYVGKYRAAEWAPPYGPIQVWDLCDESHEDALPHYAFPFVLNRWGNWSQLAVDREELHQSALSGYYQHVFGALRRWSTDDEEEAS